MNQFLVFGRSHFFARLWERVTGAMLLQNLDPGTVEGILPARHLQWSLKTPTAPVCCFSGQQSVPMATGAMATPSISASSINVLDSSLKMPLVTPPAEPPTS